MPSNYLLDRADPVLIASQCVARKVPELCQPYTPGKSDQDLAVRLSRVEQIIQTALPQHWSATHNGSYHDFNGSDRRRSHSLGADDDRGSQADDEDMSAGIYESGSWFGTTASGSVAAPAMLEKVRVTRHFMSQSVN